MAKRPKESDAVTRVLKNFERAKKHHEQFCRDAERRYSAYRGVLEKRSDAAKWTSKQHPMIVHHLVETFVASMVEDKFRFQVKPRPRLTSMEEVQELLDAAEAQQILLTYQLDQDRFVEKQRTFALQGGITGLTVGKSYWAFDADKVPRRERQMVMGPDGPEEQEVTVERLDIVRDDPTFEVVDVRDFIWPESAVSLERAPFLIHRVWMTMDELRRLEQDGIYKNVAELGEAKEGSGGAMDRELRDKNADRTKGMVEVLEHWTPDRVTTIARNVLLAEGENPFEFRHLPHRYPFTVCSAMPDMFQIPGMSEVEVVAELQEMVWTLMNQRLDNLQLVNNAIMLIRGDVDDPDAFEFAPGEKWIVEDPQQVSWFKPDPAVGTISLSAEAQLMGMIQNISGGMPFMSGTQSQTVDQTTATGVSIITSLGQRRLAAKKQQFQWCYERVADQWLALNSQFVKQKRLVEIVGRDGAQGFREIFPSGDAAQLRVNIEPASESLLRQERRAEAQALLQVVVQAAPYFLAAQTPFNLKAFGVRLLKAFDIDDVESYFSAMPQQMPAQGMGTPNGQPSGAPEPGGGFTSPQAVSPLAPSNPTSMSPEIFNQQALAMRGAGRNA